MRNHEAVLKVRMFRNYTAIFAYFGNVFNGNGLRVLKTTTGDVAEFNDIGLAAMSWQGTKNLPRVPVTGTFRGGARDHPKASHTPNGGGHRQITTTENIYARGGAMKL